MLAWLFGFYSEFVTYVFVTRTSLDLNLKHSLLEKKSEHDVHARKQREKDRNLK